MCSITLCATKKLIKTHQSKGKKSIKLIKNLAKKINKATITINNKDLRYKEANFVEVLIE